ncbi:hypothetical protein PAMP_011318 [Pampus punctatissimus]
MRVEEGSVEISPELGDVLDSYDISIQTMKGVIATHLRSLLDSFNRYFPKDDTAERYDSPAPVCNTCHQNWRMPCWTSLLTAHYRLLSHLAQRKNSGFIKEHTVSSPFVFKGVCLAASWVSNPQPLRPNQDNNTSL